MSRFSPKVSSFLEKVGADPHTQVAIVTGSSCHAGDVLFFKYDPITGEGSKGDRLVLLVRPVFRSARTGNLLMTGFTLPVDGDFDLGALKILYKMGTVKMDQGLGIYKTLNKIEGRWDPTKVINPATTVLKQLKQIMDTVVPENSYRTYIYSRIDGPIRRVSREKE